MFSHVLILLIDLSMVPAIFFGSKYSKIDQVKFAEDSL